MLSYRRLQPVKVCRIGELQLDVTTFFQVTAKSVYQCASAGLAVRTRYRHYSDSKAAWNVTENMKTRTLIVPYQWHCPQIMPLCLCIRARLRRAHNANGLCVNASSPHRYVAILPSRPGESGRRRQSQGLWNPLTIAGP